MPRQFGSCPDYYVALEQAHLVRSYVGGDFTVYDALDMNHEDFKAVYVVAAAKNVAEAARIKKAKQKGGK